MAGKVKPPQLPRAIGGDDDSVGRHIAVNQLRILVAERQRVGNLRNANGALKLVQLVLLDGKRDLWEVVKLAEEVAEAGCHGFRGKRDKVFAFGDRECDAQHVRVAQLLQLRRATTSEVNHFVLGFPVQCLVLAQRFLVEDENACSLCQTKHVRTCVRLCVCVLVCLCVCVCVRLCVYYSKPLCYLRK